MEKIIKWITDNYNEKLSVKIIVNIIVCELIVIFYYFMKDLLIMILYYVKMR